MAENVKTDVNGAVAVPTAVNGNYEITATKTGYIAAGGNKTVDCRPVNNCSCNTSITLALDQPRCDPDTAHSVTLPVIVKDNITNQLVEGALVTLILTNSLSGPSMTPVDQPRYTDTSGIMKMIVKDSLKNEPVVGAQVKVSIDTFEGAKEISA